MFFFQKNNFQEHASGLENYISGDPTGVYIMCILAEMHDISNEQGPYSREDHLTLRFFRNFKMRNS